VRHALLIAALAFALLMGIFVFVTPGSAVAQTPMPPPCPDSAAAAHFVELPARAPVGAPQIFYIEEGRQYSATGAFKVRMVNDRGRQFFSGAAEPVLDRLYIRLDWGNRFATIFAVGTVEDTDGNTCRAEISKRIRAINRAYFPGRCYDVRYKPRNVVIACGDGNLQLRRMRWRGWNRKVARGDGIALYNDCIPYCAAGRLHRIRVRVRLSGRRRCPQVGRYVYTKLNYRFPRRPIGSSRTRGSAPFPCRLYSLASRARSNAVRARSAATCANTIRLGGRSYVFYRKGVRCAVARR